MLTALACPHEIDGHELNFVVADCSNVQIAIKKLVAETADMFAALAPND